MAMPFFPENNAESWQQLRKFIEEFPGNARSSAWKQMAGGVVSELERRGLIPLFRAGKSMQHVIFSTSDHHGLRDEPRVTLEFQPEQQEVRIAYSKADIRFHEPLIEAWVSAPVALQVTLGALRRLWTETWPAQPMPEELQEHNRPTQE